MNDNNFAVSFGWPFFIFQKRPFFILPWLLYGEHNENALRKEVVNVKHNLHVSVSKAPQTDSLVTCRNVSIREKLLRFLFGKKQRVTVLIPGDTIEELSISENCS